MLTNVRKTIGILEPKDFSEKAIKMLRSNGFKIKFFNKDDSLDNFLSNIYALFVRLKYQINDEFFSKAPVLKYICTPTTGLNHIDLKACKKKNIEIISLKGEIKFLNDIRATPEHTFGLVISLLRNYKSCLNEASKWDRDSCKGFEIFKKNIGIIGYGRVGSIVAKYFKAFDANVRYYDPKKNFIKDKDNIAEQANSIENLINNSEIIILTASYNGEIILDKNLIDLMENKFFINTSRGELIDETYLFDKIKKNFFKGIALDVISNETNRLNIENALKLRTFPNVIITPHMAGATYESMWKTEEFIVNKFLQTIKSKN